MLPRMEIVAGGFVVAEVVRYVVGGGLKYELFVELMAMMGKTGCRKAMDLDR